MPFLNLGLSEAQQKELIDIVDECNDLISIYMSNMISVDIEMADVMEADEFDEKSA